LSPDKPRPVVHVVAGAVIDAAGRVLSAQRLSGTHLAGGWEFPGGKLERGEERTAGLARELQEELGIAITTPRPLVRVRHTYPSREILLDMWVVKRYRGEPNGLDGQPLRWCSLDELATAPLLPADKPIVAALRLPERLTEAATPHYRIGDLATLRLSPSDADSTPHSQLHGALCFSTSEAATAVGAGARFLVMQTTLADAQLAALCESVPVPVYARGIELERAWALGATGLNETALLQNLE
jgi:8-oxo-dGTP diphosphatase